MRGRDCSCSCKILLYNELHRLDGRGPVVHQAAPALEQIRARVGGLDLVLDDMRKGGFHDFAGVVGLLGRPVPKGRPEPMRHGADLQLPEQLRRRSCRRAASRGPPGRRTPGRPACVPRRESPWPAETPAPGVCPAFMRVAGESSTPGRPGRSRPTSRTAPRPSARRSVPETQKRA